MKQQTSEEPQANKVNSATYQTETSVPAKLLRRDFVAASSMLAGTMALPAAHASESNEIRVGLIGCGGRGTGAAVNAMKADRDVRIVALADLFPEALSNCRKSLQQRYADQFIVDDERCYVGFDSYQELLNSDVDVVLLASPPCYRPDHLEAAVEAGKEIFCEKPIAVDPVGVRRVEKACKVADKKGINVVSGLCWRYDRGMQETIQQVFDGKIGTVVTTQANYLTNPIWTKVRRPGESDLMYQCRNWYNFTWASGDHIVEQFIHSLDKAIWLRDDTPPVKAYGLGGRQNREETIGGNIYDHFSVVYEWASGSRTFANTRQMRGCFNQTEDFVFGTKGIAKLCKHQIDGLIPWTFEGDEVQMHQAEQNEMFKAIRGERPRINNGDYMCKSTLMAIMGREACYTGKTISWDQVSNSEQSLVPEGLPNADAPEVNVPMPGRYVF